MKRKIEKELRNILGSDLRLERSSGEHGDYASNVAFYLAKKEKRNPSEIAGELKEKIDSKYFQKVEEKNGFLNFFLSEELLKEELRRILEEKEDYGKRKKTGKRVVIDYSSPNIAKSFGVGHLRSTIIGHSLYKIYSFMGWEAVGINHLGDWGTQYGKLLYQIKKESKDPEKLTIDQLEELYVRFHKEAENNPQMEEEGREWFAKLEKGDREARKIWDVCRRKSLEEFDRIYDALEIEIDHVTGESFYEDKLADVIKEAREKGVARESEGALIIEFEDMPPAMILKSDGSTTYLTRDLAAAKYRLEKFSPDLMIYEIGVDQELHLRQLFSAVEKLGWAEKEKFFHVAHGMFRLKEGKFSTRKGRTIHLKEVLDLATKKARELSPEGSKDDIRRIGIGGVKYNDLKRHYKREVVFDWERILSMKGDSGPYLQYTCVRCKSVLEKAGDYVFEPGELNEKERKVVKRLAQFEEVVEQAMESFSPNVVAEYAYKLAKEYNAFYDEFAILGNNKRLAITEGVFVVLRQCLALLTISLPEKM